MSPNDEARQRQLRTLAAAIKPRWIREEAHQQMKVELGLDHFEGRSWQGLHRHALMTMCQFSFCTLPPVKRCHDTKDVS